MGADYSNPEPPDNPGPPKRAALIESGTRQKSLGSDPDLFLLEAPLHGVIHDGRTAGCGAERPAVSPAAIRPHLKTSVDGGNSRVAPPCSFSDTEECHVRRCQ